MRKARQAMDECCLIARLEGVRRQENGEEVVTTMIACLEGALMMSKRYDDLAHMEGVAGHLESYFAHEVVK